MHHYLIFEKYIKSIDSSFFKRSKKDQDKFLIENSARLEDDYDSYLYSVLFNMSYSDDIELDDEQLLDYNICRCYFKGIGENYFFLNENMDFNENMLTFDTLYDYDYNDHLYQERAIMEQSPEKTSIDPYRLRLTSRWARCFLNEMNKDTFYYLILNSASCIVMDNIENNMNKLIKELIPHKIDREFHGSLFNLNINANGKEDELEALNKYRYVVYKEIFNSLNTFFDEKRPQKIWIRKDTSIPKDPTVYYTFSDQFVCQNIRFAHWQKDIDKYITDDTSILDEVEEKFQETAKNSILKFYNSL